MVKKFHCLRMDGGGGRKVNLAVGQGGAVVTELAGCQTFILFLFTLQLQNIIIIKFTANTSFIN